MEADYHFASILQKQFENEDTTVSANDHQVAALLQEQYSREYITDNPGGNLVYNSKDKKRICDTSKSLIDPSWELIDPTPNIHILFVAFNTRFFWNKLLSVCVSWSKRMTSCAGVCSYSGRGGMCQITLSEPLLKLRPRKDLVETLLHEMIHAYLFVTHNNKDRDGHGPEFHKHMYRINAETGTNITVYHDFHDEVRLYQQHWWRCDGPCRNRRPFFGTVRRATNRAPGPNDRWWADHRQTCGGTFIKVKEPEKKTGKKNESKLSNTKVDIRKYIPTTKIAASVKENHVVDSYNKPNALGKIGTSENTSKIHPLNTTSNIHGFVNPRNNSTSSMIKNSSSTIVVNTQNRFATPHINRKPKIKETLPTSASPSKSSSAVSSGTTSTVPSSSSTLLSNPFNVTRNHWVNKFNNRGLQNNSNTGGLKRPMLENTELSPKSQKIKKGEASAQLHLEQVECPICYAKYSPKELDVHIDTCINESREFQECIICGVHVIKSCYEEHTRKCVDENFKDDFNGENPVLDHKTIKKCHNCCEAISEDKFDTHITTCIGKNNDAVVDLTKDEITEKLCPVCDKNILSSKLEGHVETCLSLFYDDMEKVYSNSQTTKCVSCNKDIVKTELNTHLEECIAGIFKDDFLVDNCDNDRYTCPLCMNLFTEVEMAYHIEVCLNSNDSNKPESQLGKKSVIDSLLSENEF